MARIRSSGAHAGSHRARRSSPPEREGPAGQAWVRGTREVAGRVRGLGARWGSGGDDPPDQAPPEEPQPLPGLPESPLPRRSPSGQGPPGQWEGSQDGLRQQSQPAAGQRGSGQAGDGYPDAGYPPARQSAGYRNSAPVAPASRRPGQPEDRAVRTGQNPGQAPGSGAGGPAGGTGGSGPGQAGDLWQPARQLHGSGRQAGLRPPADKLAAGPLIMELRAATRSFSAWAAGTSAVRLARTHMNRRRTIALIGAVVVLGISLLLGWASPEPEAETTVQQFLLAWQAGHYQNAAALTNGKSSAVAAQLQASYRQLGAADLALTMGHISQHGRTAQASFGASFDLGRGGPPWVYQGHFTLHRHGSSWKVDWSPSVIVPALRPGYRLAVVTTVPPRAQLLDQTGRPLARRSQVYQVGVRPGELKHPEVTGQALARAVGSPQLGEEMTEQIQTAPADDYLELVMLQPATYHRLKGALDKVTGLKVRTGSARLFDSIAPAVAGSVGTETAPILQANGVPYRPGTTIGLSGLQEAYQRRLAGTPTTRVVLENAAGRQIAVLQRWQGSTGLPVRTTISGVAQRAADGVVGSLSDSAAIVAVRPSGQILAVAQHQVAGMPAVSPLDGRYRPGQAFTIVSTAALLADGGVKPDTQTLCHRSNVVGSERFVNEPAEPDLGPAPLFSEDFAHACATAFTGLALNLKAAALSSTASKFGIGQHWTLPGDLPAFAGTGPAGSDAAQLAANSIGIGSVRVSPLGMALAVGVVQSGSWHPPALITSPANQQVQESAAFQTDIVSQLRSLMRAAVRNGAARAANVRGSAVYGQVGSAPLGQHGLWANWFVGYNGNVAFAVLSFDKSPSNSPAALAGRFVRALHARL